jgi:hypothetical protein
MPLIIHNSQFTIHNLNRNAPRREQGRGGIEGGDEKSFTPWRPEEESNL